MSDVTEKDIEDIESLFSRPFAVPDAFKRWAFDQFALGVPSLPVSQLVGGRAIERILYSNKESASFSGNSEQAVCEIPLTGKGLVKNGRIKVDVAFAARSPDSGIYLYLRLKLGSTTVCQGRFAEGVLDPTDSNGHAVFTLWNMDSYAAQAADVRAFCGGGSYGGGVALGFGFSTVDLADDTTLSVAVDFDTGDSNDVFTRKSVIATIYNPAEGDQ